MSQPNALLNRHKIPHMLNVIPYLAYFHKRALKELRPLVWSDRGALCSIETTFYSGQK